MTIKFDIDNLLQNSNNKIIISGDGLFESRQGITAAGITGIMTNELSLSVSNDFGSLVNPNKTLEALSETIGRAATSAASVFDSDKLGDFIQNLAPRTLLHTVSTWSGSSKPTFPISLLFLRVKRSDNISLQIQSLYKTVLPTKNIKLPIVGNTTLTTIRAPLGYFPTSEHSADGTLSIQIGKWFTAHDLVARSVEATFSKEISTDGFPLYATATIVLEPFRMITYDEFQAYFTNT